MTTRRAAHVIRLKPEHRLAYEEAHADPWPEVLEGLERQNIVTYSIFLHDDLLFAYVEYDDDATIPAPPPTPQAEEWGRKMREMMEPLPTRAPGEWWAGMREVFHFEPPVDGHSKQV